MQDRQIRYGSVVRFIVVTNIRTTSTKMVPVSAELMASSPCPPMEEGGR